MSAAGTPQAMRTAKAFTFVELLIVLFLVSLILFASYKVFFQQTRMVRQSLEEIKVNDDFRKILAFMGNDVRESTRIDEPAPIRLEDARTLATKAGLLMRIAKEEQDPTLDREDSLGQIAVRRTIVYELEDNPNPLEPSVPRFRLVRIESIDEHGRSGESTQRHVICDDVRDLVVFRTIRKPLPPHNVDALGDRLVQPQSASVQGTGNDVVHLRVTLERTRMGGERGEVFRFPMQTCFYKRGKEIWRHP
ncbi:MAG TPA: prepilin-type N-terminal cleavage/methylation domain-containing protein [Candidatus Ozemobacteraceae bacterium]|nr:prepilin-type N-terminal cleavage/methylation domain-containing protein [Candidatus Ozemobacteraceae bacterium]HQG27165.1 prepilin-type N-terminal cleavage/methylation domain-containing protein [Candidatus Ozemobacteraceae bacterium]